MFATLVFEDDTARFTCRALTARGRKTHTSRKLFFGRTKK